mmetsp:Transcript_21899/g.72597  ORF Transcript_21899/g.72597 Transcript_21899/m.72597 type:complete len:230 (+) Transcript_21899:395-1084(+)
MAVEQEAVHDARGQVARRRVRAADTHRLEPRRRVEAGEGEASRVLLAPHRRVVAPIQPEERAERAVDVGGEARHPLAQQRLPAVIAVVQQREAVLEEARQAAHIQQRGQHPEGVLLREVQQKHRRVGGHALRVAERAVVARVRAEDATECRLPVAAAAPKVDVPAQRARHVLGDLLEAAAVLFSPARAQRRIQPVHTEAWWRSRRRHRHPDAPPHGSRHAAADLLGESR